MKLFTLVVPALAVVGALAQQNNMTVPTLATVVACEPKLIEWSGGTPPYTLTVQPAGQPNAPPLVSFPETNFTSFTWLVNLGAGTSVALALRDKVGALAQSGIFTIVAGERTDCLTEPLSVSASQTGTPSKTATGAISNSTTSGALSQFNIGAATIVGAVAFVLAA